MLSSHARYHLDLVFANLLFGVNFSYYVSLIRHYLDFQTIFMLQIVVSAFFFIPFALFSRQSYRLDLRDFVAILLVTLLIVYGWMYMLLWGAKYTSPIDASTIATLGPAFTLLATHILNRERITFFRTAGFLLALCGAGILLFDHGRTFIQGSEGYGNALVLIAVICIAVNTVIISPVLRRRGTLVVMGWYYIIGLAITAPFFWKYARNTAYAELPFGAVMELLYILLLGTVLPSYLLYKGTEKLTAVHTALYRYIQPVITTVVAVWRGQERIDKENIIAASLIFLGIVMVVMGYEVVLQQVKRLLKRPVATDSPTGSDPEPATPFATTLQNEKGNSPTGSYPTQNRSSDNDTSDNATNDTSSVQKNPAERS